MSRAVHKDKPQGPLNRIHLEAGTALALLPGVNQTNALANGGNMAKVNLKKEVAILIDKGKVPKRVNGKMKMGTDGGEVLITKTGENMVAYDFVSEGRRVLVTLPSEDGNAAIMKESKIPDPKPAEDAAPKPEKAPKVAKVKEPKPVLEPNFVEQKDDKGNPEVVDFNVYKNIITCVDCGEIRYVKDSDRHQVTRCKLHAKKARRKRIRASRKARGVGKKKDFIETKKEEKEAAAKA